MPGTCRRTAPRWWKPCGIFISRPSPMPKPLRRRPPSPRGCSSSPASSPTKPTPTSPRWRPPPKAGTLDGWEVVVKPHPYLPVVERLKNLYGGAEPPSVVDGPIGNFLTPGTVVWASNSTTVALEAAFRKPARAGAGRRGRRGPLPLAGPPRRGQRPHGFRRGRRPRRSQGPDLPPDYLALDPELPRWKERLGL